MIRDFLLFSINNLKARKLRSWLTIVGIVIGVGSIIALFAISQGLNNSITEQFNKIGADKLFVFSKGAGDPIFRSGLTNDDAEALERLAIFESVIPTIVRSVTVGFGKDEKNNLVTGWPAEDLEKFATEFDTPLREGIFPKRDGFTAILGFKAADELFDKKVRLRSKIEIEGKKFEVVGIFEPIGFEDDDNSITIPLKTAQRVFGTGDALTAITLQMKRGVDPLFAVNEARKALAREKGERVKADPEEQSFEVVTPDQILAQFNTVLGIVQAVLIGIAAISLLVGAVGIMNSMYTSVVQRTREIGIMKSIGAKRRDIVIIFMIESAIVGGLGGILGVILGMVIAFLVEIAATTSGFILLDVQLSAGLILFGIVFALGVGILAGTLPAIQASKLSPINAVRYD